VLFNEKGSIGSETGDGSCYVLAQAGQSIGLRFTFNHSHPIINWLDEELQGRFSELFLWAANKFETGLAIQFLHTFLQQLD